MNKVDVSVIVPIYGVEKYLNKCIDSLLNQNFKNYEIILVDDGSPDNCGNICDDYAEKYSNILSLHKENGGLSSARNYGIDYASGEYLIFVDSDDFVDKQMISLLYNTVIKDNSEIAICNRMEYYEFKNEYKKSYENNLKHKTFTFKEAIKELCSFNLFDMSAWAKIYKQSLFSDVRFPDGKLSEDYYIMYKLFEKCNKISYINEYLYYYVQRRGSISKNKKINYDYRIAAFNQMEYIERKYPELKKYVRSAYAFANMTIFNWYITNRNCIPNREEYLKLFTQVKENYRYIIDNEKISRQRKVQAKIFIMGRYLYLCFYKIYLIIK